MVVTQRERQRDFERFLTFVDAVVAIAITLLVLPLVDVANELHGQSVWHLLDAHQAEIFGFLLSFAVIAQLWFTQHGLLHNVVAQDPLVARLMVVWLLSIVALPFPTALVAQQGHQVGTKVLYIGMMTLSAACLAGISWQIARTPSIRDSTSTPDTLEGVVTVAMFLIALVLSLVVPPLSYWPLLLLLLSRRGTRILHRLRGGRHVAG